MEFLSEHGNKIKGKEMKSGEKSQVGHQSWRSKGQKLGVPGRKDEQERRKRQRNDSRKCFITEAHVRIERAH